MTYDTVWKNRLWKQLAEYGIDEKIWRVLEKIAECTKASLCLLNNVNGEANSCTLSTTLLQLLINDVFKVVESVGMGLTAWKTSVS